MIMKQKYLTPVADSMDAISEGVICSSMTDPSSSGENFSSGIDLGGDWQ